MFKKNSAEPARIQYLGAEGVSLACLHAVMQVLQYPFPVEKVQILTSAGVHCFLLTVRGELLAIKSGFSSGYGGEGPRTFSYVLMLFYRHVKEVVLNIEEYNVPKGMLERLDSSSLTRGDLAELDELWPVRPARWFDYLWDEHRKAAADNTLWQDFPPVIPYTIINPRIMDLALSFWDGPDDKLLKAYRRLEDAVRGRIGSGEHGTKLFKEAFTGDKAALEWKSLDKSEQIGRGSLFINTFMAYRNARAHREESGSNFKEQLREFLLLNELYELEARASPRPEPTREPGEA